MLNLEIYNCQRRTLSRNVTIDFWAYLAHLG